MNECPDYFEVAKKDFDTLDQMLQELGIDVETFTSDNEMMIGRRKKQSNPNFSFTWCLVLWDPEASITVEIHIGEIGVSFTIDYPERIWFAGLLEAGTYDDAFRAIASPLVIGLDYEKGLPVIKEIVGECLKRV